MIWGSSDDSAMQALPQAQPTHHHFGRWITRPSSPQLNDPQALGASRIGRRTSPALKTLLQNIETTTFGLSSPSQVRRGHRVY